MSGSAGAPPSARSTPPTCSTRSRAPSPTSTRWPRAPTCGRSSASAPRSRARTRVCTSGCTPPAATTATRSSIRGSRMSTDRERFLDDGRLALEWVAGYLDRLPELPVLAQTAPGDVRRRLPSAPPDEPEPFAAVLRDLDEVLLPGVTHWQHPRYFAYFAVSASEPG